MLSQKKCAPNPPCLPPPTSACNCTNETNSRRSHPSTVHTDRDESARCPEDLLLAPLPDRPLPGQTWLCERCCRRGNRPLQGLRAHLSQLGGQVHAALHVRCEHGLCAWDRWQQHLLSAGIVSLFLYMPIWVVSVLISLPPPPLQLCHQLCAGTQQQWQLREPLRCWSPGAFRLRLSPIVSGVQWGLRTWIGCFFSAYDWTP